MTEIPPFLPNQFHELFDSDLWVMERILMLPSDPPPVITQVGNEIRVSINETFSMPAMQAAVADYRAQLLPVILVLAQKVYAELFRVLLSGYGRRVGWRQSDIEKGVRELLKGGVSLPHPFSDEATVRDWFSGKYQFGNLRSARNAVAHGEYSCSTGRVRVVFATMTVIDWTTEEVLAFAEEVLAAGKAV